MVLSRHGLALVALLLHNMVQREVDVCRLQQ